MSEKAAGPMSGAMDEDTAMLDHEASKRKGPCACGRFKTKVPPQTRVAPVTVTLLDEDHHGVTARRIASRYVCSHCGDVHKFVQVTRMLKLVAEAKLGGPD